MKTELCSFLILISVVFINAESQLCSNGVFKCVSPKSLRICFNDKLVASEFFCPNLTFCNENSPTICTKIRTALPAIQFSEESVTDAEMYPDIQCPEPGVFEVEDTGCTTFLNCSNLEEAQESTCDEVSLFNPETKSCDEDYVCPETQDNIHTYEDCSATSTSFICTKVGNFFLPNTNCAKYIYCKRIYIGFKAIEKSCQNNSLFDPTLGKCVKGHICKDACTITTPFQEDTTIIETTTEDSPICPGVGRFPIPNTNCTMFRLCVDTVNGMVHKEFTCPAGSYYNPDTMKCSTKYDCWPQITGTVPPVTDTTFYQRTTTFSSVTTTNIPITTTNIPISTTNIPDTTTNIPISTTNLPITITNIPITTTNIPITTTNIPITTTNISITITPDVPNTTTSDGPTEIPTKPQETTSSNPITTVEDATKDITLSTTKDSNSTDLPTTPPNTDTTDISTPNSTIAEETTTFSNPITTENTDLPTTTQKISPNSTDEPFTTTITSSTTDISTIVTCEDFSEPTKDTSENTDYTDETDPIDEETTTTLNTGEDEPTTPTIDCRNQGRLPVFKTKCKLYYQCTLTTSGYKYKTYECSEGTLFDPYLKICSGLYICPENVLNTTTDKTITEPQESTTEDYTITDSGESSEEITIELNCTQQGKVPVPNTNCLLYGQCTLTTNGFIQNVYECPKGYSYDPEMQLCSPSYICPETISSTTTDRDITTDPIKLSSSTSTSIPTTTEIQNAIPIVPSCTEQGKFPILNTNCKSYISCILTTNGFISTEYVCSGKLLFDPNLKKCSSFYICKEEITQNPKINEEEYVNELAVSAKPELDQCTESGKFPIPYSKCSQFIMCASTSNGFKFKIYSCPINSFYDPHNKRCSKTYLCPELDKTSSTETAPRTTEIINIPDCQENGKFPIYNTGCTKYILCSLTSTGFKSKEYTCPEDSFFNPEMKRCHREYICPETSTELKTTTENFSSEEISEECVSVSKEIPVCTNTGKFAVKGTHCKQYLLCTKTSLGFRSKVYNCPNDSNFDPDKNKCMVSYICTEKICREDNDKALKLIEKPIVTKCNFPGKFSIKGTNCTKFKLCEWTHSGYIKTVYDCPEGTYFNQKLQKCSENYICTETHLYDCTTIGLFEDATDTSCQYYVSCKTNSDGIVRGERKSCPTDYYFDPVIQKCSASYMCNRKLIRSVEIAPKFLVNGQCTTVGRYAIQGTNCKKYMYCADNGGGTLKGTQFTCPTTSVFNQAIQKCTATYICPDSVCRIAGRVANPNSKDCTSYIECEDIYDPTVGLTVGYTGRVVFCPIGQKFDPIYQCCSSFYVCPV